MLQEIMCPKCRAKFNSRAKKITACPKCRSSFRVKAGLKALAESAPSESGSSGNVKDASSETPSDTKKSLWDVVTVQPNDPDIAQGITASQGEAAQGQAPPAVPPGTPVAGPDGVGPGVATSANQVMYGILEVILEMGLTGKDPDPKKLLSLGAMALALMADFQVGGEGATIINVPRWLPLVLVIGTAIILPKIIQALKNVDLGGILGKLKGGLGGLMGKKKDEAPAEAAQA